MGLVKFDTSELKRLEKYLSDKKKIDKFFEDLTKEVATVVLSSAIMLTPVDTGELRRGWTGGVEKTPKDYIFNNKRVSKIGNSYKITLSNGLKYAEYVNYGHRQEVGRYVPAIGKRLVKPWVEGQYMVEKSINQAEAVLPDVCKRKTEEFLKNVFKIK